MGGSMTALLLGLAIALVLFWAVGAHNRLVRLRAAVRDQWLVVDAAWIKLIAPLQGSLAAHLAHAPEGDIRSRAEQLSLACDEMIDALTQARQKPLDTVQVQNVLGAREQLVGLTHRALSQDSPTAWPELVSLQLRMWQSLPILVGQYHQAVEAYHEAIDAWPARWLARRIRLSRVLRLDPMVAGLELAP
jgi:LemA protein